MPRRDDPVRRTEQGMRNFWDEAARTNAVWYVDTSLDFNHPDMESFFSTGRTIVSEALDGSPMTPPGRSVALEIGSGLGRVCLALADRFDRVVGVDISPEMVQRASELVPDPRVSFRVGDGASLQGIDDASVDLVLSFTVFQHIPRIDVIERYLEEAGRVLRPGGLLVFQWNNGGASAWWAARRAVLAGLQKTGLKAERHLRNAPEFLGSRVPLDRIKSAVARGGMDLKQTKGLGSLFAWAWAVREG
jgi:SAM-dependent methyltransferase